jgi:hypothetical protein
VRCCNGLVKRHLKDIRLRFVGVPPSALAALIPRVPSAGAATDAPPEIEVVFSPGSGTFSGSAECNILVVFDDVSKARRLARQAHVLVADNDVPDSRARRRFRLCEFEAALKSAA